MVPELPNRESRRAHMASIPASLASKPGKIWGIDVIGITNSATLAFFVSRMTEFPDYLLFLGPNTPISNGSLIGALEATGDYFVRLIE